MKRMLINATQQEELRMAMVDGQRLYDLNIEGPASERKKANIYKGKITRIEPSLEAAFVDYGSERHGFLPLKEISAEYFVREVESGKKPSIRDVLKEGQDIVVQIDKEERGNKGAALTTYVSLAGRFIVLKPNKARSGGVSRRIVGEDRDLARQSLKDVDVPEGMSVILRTAGIDRSAEELAWDLETLMRVWQAILDHVLTRPAPFLLYREDNAVIRALRDYLTNEIGEILIDDETTYNEAREFVQQVMPHNERKLKLYTDPVPLFTRFQIETQIESAFAHSVSLPSGGSIVIDHTEAMVSIDINSARATKGGDIEATALNTNLEAAEEIARQLRIRDLGGLVVIDFIDMGPQKNQRAVENRLREAVRQDRARVQIGKISRFGLLEMSRQRLRPSIGESAYQTCPRCSGFGTIRSIESLALAILRIVGEEARKERTAKVIAQLPVEVATYLLNEKRDWVQGLEASHDTQVVLVANAALETPHYDVRRVRDDQTELPENAGVSYALAEVSAEAAIPQSMEERKAVEQAAIDVIKPATPAPKRQTSGGLLAWLKSLFSSGETKPKKSKKKTKRAQSSRGRRGDQRRDDGRGRKAGRKTSRKKETAKKSSNKNSDQPAKKTRPKQSPQSESDRKTAESRDEQQRPARKRRSRGGRRRRRSADRTRSSDARKESVRDTAAARSADKPDSPPASKDNAASTAADSRQPARAKAGAPKPAGERQGSRAPEKTAADGPPKAEAAAKAGSKPAPTDDAASKQADTGGPPRARTDAERAADAAKERTVEATKSRPPQSATKAGDRATNGNGSGDKPADKPVRESQPEKKAEEKPAGRLLPWDAPAPAPEPSDEKPAGDSPDQS